MLSNCQWERISVLSGPFTTPSSAHLTVKETAPSFPAADRGQRCISNPSSNFKGWRTSNWKDPTWFSQDDLWRRAEFRMGWRSNVSIPKTEILPMCCLALGLWELCWYFLYIYRFWGFTWKEFHSTDTYGSSNIKSNSRKTCALTARPQDVAAQCF